MPRKAEMSGLPVLARMRMIRKILIYLAEVCVENRRAVQIDFDRRSLHGYFLKIPFAYRPQEPSLRRGHSVSGTVRLTWIEIFVFRIGIVQHLQFAHPDVCRVSGTRIADGQA